jgi:dihydroxy-acid dehydratase
LSEDFYHAGGVPAVMAELSKAGLIKADAITVNGKTIGSNYRDTFSQDHNVIRNLNDPIKSEAGMMVLSGNLFDSAIMKISAVSEDFKTRYLSNPDDPYAFELNAVVFEGPEDYHARINDPKLPVDEQSILVIRGCGTLGYPGSAEVVNMMLPDRLVKKGVTSLPTLGDGRQSGTSDAPSIINASPEAAAGGGLARLRTGDRVRVDLNKRKVNALVSEKEWEQRELVTFVPESQTPWQQIYRETVGQLEDGGVMKPALNYSQIAKKTPRHSH